MTWQDVRARYPERWLLVEAMRAHSERNRRIVEQLDVVDAFDRSGEAMRRYVQLHHEAPEREFYVVHTRRESLDIEEDRWFGIRPA